MKSYLFIASDTAISMSSPRKPLANILPSGLTNSISGIPMIE